MIGFNLKINKKKFNIGINSGVLLLAFDNGASGHSSGIDLTIGQKLKWDDIVLKNGDKVKITASNVTNTMSPCSKEKLDLQELMDEYHNLKKLLTEKGLLK